MKQLFKPVFALVAIMTLKGHAAPKGETTRGNSEANTVSASIDKRQAVKSLIESKLGDKITVELSTVKGIQVATQVFGSKDGSRGGKS